MSPANRSPEPWRTHSCVPRRHSWRRLAASGGHPDESGCGTHECVRHRLAPAPPPAYFSVAIEPFVVNTVRTPVSIPGAVKGLSGIPTI